VPDFAARLGGRGVWVHPRGACLKRAVRGGFARALRAEVAVDFASLQGQACGQLARRLEGLALAAKRRRMLALGTDAARLALAACTAHLLLVAKDAAGRRDEIVAHATERGVPVIELSSKDELGHLMGKDTLGLLAVLDVQIAREIADSARWLAGLSEGG
jgi:ribosomal protein L7Ae-like RNA K-turn-binding protein